MNVGEMHKGEIWIDGLGHVVDEVEIDENGNGTFLVNDGSVSVYICRD